MFHPLLTDLSDKTTEQLLDDINSLTNKLTYMYKLNKQDMVRQISMLLNAYRTEYTKRQNELFDKKINDKSKISIK